jgi:hypothetical protein
MYSRSVGNSTHDATERIDLTHEMSLGDPTDCRVTRHLSD